MCAAAASGGVPRSGSPVQSEAVDQEIPVPFNGFVYVIGAERGDDRTSYLIVSDIIWRNGLQVWFVAEHVLDAPLTQAV